MKVRETIAFIGDADIACDRLIRKLAAENYPIVLVAKAGNHFENLSRQISNRLPQADIETIDCEREGCWEADIIIFNNMDFFADELSEKIKEVTNQKILVYFLTKDEHAIPGDKIKNFQQLLPNTEWVQVIFDPVSNDMHLTGANKATAVIENMLNRAGYATRFPATTV